MLLLYTSHIILDPLYDGAPISQTASWLSIYQYAVSNRLTDHATMQLLDLIKIHCPSPSFCAPSLYKLKRKLGKVDGLEEHTYCSECTAEIPNHLKNCPKRMCRRKKSRQCYFSILPFEKHLEDIFTGISI